MGHKHIVVCDGCDKEELIARPEGEGPPTFESVTVSIKAGPDTAFDLCPACYRRLINVADPRKWSRVTDVAQAA